MNNKRILAAVHLYPPTHLCGGEMYLHRLLKALQAQGHEVRVLLFNSGAYGIHRVYTYQGVEVFPSFRDVITANLEWADLIITHLDYTGQVMGMAAIYRKPVVHLAHSDISRAEIRNASDGQAVIYNSEWSRSQLEPGYRHPGFVLRPPVDPLEFDTGANPAKNEHITLINLDQNKGGMILTRIAQALPHRKFIGVVGSYSQPRKLGQFTRQPPNVEVVAKTARITDIYARTRILIMPSEYESWGMVAQEAACSGIPTISTGTPGLRENCGTAGIYVKDREDTAEWVRHIEALMTDAKLYKSKSEAARKRARQLDPDQPLRDVGNWIRRITFNGLMEPETETKRGKAHGTTAHH